MSEHLKKQVEKEDELVFSILASDYAKLNKWERDFLKSIEEFNEAGIGLTEKQLTILQRIDDKLQRLEKDD